MSDPSAPHTTIEPDARQWRASGSRGTGRNRAPGRWGLARALLVLGLVVLIGYPLAMVVAAVALPEAFGARPAAWSELAGDRVVRAWGNTLRLAVAVTALSVVFAVPVALLAWRSRAARWLDLIMTVPFLTPPFLVGLAWTQTVGRRGFASRLGLDGALLGDWLFSLGGMALLMAVNYAPLVYFALRAQLARLPPSLVWAARVAGAGRGTALVRIVLPLVAPALLAGGFLAFASALGEYGTPLVIGQRIGYPVVATEIARLVSVAPIHLSLASALGATLLVAGVAAYAASRLLQRSHLGSGVRAGYPLAPLLSVPARGAAWGVVALFAVVGVIVPFGAIGVGSLMRLVSPGPRLDNLGWTHYRELLTAGSTGFGALSASFVLAGIAALAALALGVLIARVGRGAALLATVPVAVPAIVMAVGFLRGWNAPWAADLPIYGTGAILALYYLAQYLPFPVQYVQAGIRSLPASLEPAARVHGAGAGMALWRIGLPLLWPHALGGAILVFSIAFRELVGSVLLRPPSVQTTSTYVLQQFDQGSTGAGLAMAMVAMTAALVSVVTARRFAASDASTGR